MIKHMVGRITLWGIALVLLLLVLIVQNYGRDFSLKTLPNDFVLSRPNGATAFIVSPDKSISNGVLGPNINIYKIIDDRFVIGDISRPGIDYVGRIGKIGLFFLDTKAGIAATGLSKSELRRIQENPVDLIRNHDVVLLSESYKAQSRPTHE